MALCIRVYRLLCEPTSLGLATTAAYQALREATRLLAVPWPITPSYAFIPIAQDETESDESPQHATMHIGFVVLKPEYAPERATAALHMPCTLGEAEDALQVLRATEDFIRYPHLLNVNPQPLNGLAVFVALPRWYPTATVLCLNTTAIDGRIFATFAPDRLDTAELLWLANLPTQMDIAVYVGGDDQPLPDGTQVHVASGDQVLFVESGEPPHTVLHLHCLSCSCVWSHGDNQTDFQPLLSTRPTV